MSLIFNSISFTFINLKIKNLIMISQNIALYNWNNGVIMIGVFALVCVILVIALIVFMASGKKKEETEE